MRLKYCMEMYQIILLYWNFIWRGYILLEVFLWDSVWLSIWVFYSKSKVSVSYFCQNNYWVHMGQLMTQLVTKVGKVMFYTCLSFCPQVVCLFLACITGHMTRRRFVLWRGFCLLSRICPLGVCILRGLLWVGLPWVGSGVWSLMGDLPWDHTQIYRQTPPQILRHCPLQI